MLDLFISHPKKSGHLMNVQTEIIKGHLFFNVVSLIWNESEQENDELKLASYTPPEFGRWWDTMHNAGWRAMK